MVKNKKNANGELKHYTLYVAARNPEHRRGEFYARALEHETNNFVFLILESFNTSEESEVRPRKRSRLPSPLRSINLNIHSSTIKLLAGTRRRVPARLCLSTTDESVSLYGH